MNDTEDKSNADTSWDIKQLTTYTGIRHRLMKIKPQEASGQ